MRPILVLVPFLVAFLLVAPTHAEGAQYVQRTDIASPPAQPEDKPLASFVHVSDIHLVDDDAWTLRVEYLDALAPNGSPLPFGAAWRPDEEYTDEVFATQVRGIDQQPGLDFVMATGDSTDNDLENELVRVLDVAHGTVTTKGPVSGATLVPDAQASDPWKVANAALEGTAAPASFDPATTPASLQAAGVPPALREAGANPGLRVPFFMALGNHDHLAQGNAPAYPFRAASQAEGRLFLHASEYVRTLFGGAVPCDGAGRYVGAPEDGAGLGHVGDRLCDGNYQNDGYYAFEKGPVRFLVLDTANDDIFGTNANTGRPSVLSLVDGGSGVGGRDTGSIDIDQFRWLQAQLDDAQASGKVVVLFSHHDPSQWFYPEGSQALGYVTGLQVQALVASHDNVVGYFTGHGHDERATVENGANRYWDVQTGSLIDLPQETRRVDLSYVGDGVVALKLTMLPTDCSRDAAYPALQDACVKSAALSWSDPQRDEGHVGAAGDRDAVLYVHVGAAAQRALDALG